MDAGTILEVVSKTADWVHVRFTDAAGSSVDGFISAPLVELATPQKADPPPTPPPARTEPTVQAPPSTPPSAPVPAPIRIPTAPSAVEKQEWTMRLADAHERAGRAKKILWAGVGLVGVSFLARALSNHNAGGGGYSGDPATLGIASLGILAGAGLATFGFVKMTSASHQISNLNQEGKTKGFAVLLSPTRASVGFSVVF